MPLSPRHQMYQYRSLAVGRADSARRLGRHSADTACHAILISRPHFALKRWRYDRRRFSRRRIIYWRRLLMMLGYARWPRDAPSAMAGFFARHGRDGRFHERSRAPCPEASGRSSHETGCHDDAHEIAPMLRRYAGWRCSIQEEIDSAVYAETAIRRPLPLDDHATSLYYREPARPQPAPLPIPAAELSPSITRRGHALFATSLLHAIPSP